jgi:predicted outer membrane repeat protein
MNSLRRNIFISVLPVIFLTIAHAATNYVWQGSPAPAVPYDTWETAAHVIQDAIDVSVSGNVVLVTNGVYDTGGAVTPGYELKNRIVVTNAIVVSSINGPEHTSIVGFRKTSNEVTNSARCVYLSGGGTLSGFTLEKGGAQQPANYFDDLQGGGIVMKKNTILTNCVVRSNTAEYSGGGIYGITNATIVDCVVSNNTSEYGGGVSLEFHNTLLNVVIKENYSYNLGGGIYSENQEIVRNCVISHNYAVSSGGGIYIRRAGIIANSEICGNISSQYCGGISINYGRIITNCNIYGNKAYRVGGVRITRGGQIVECTISNNTSDSAYGGLWLRNGSTARWCRITGNASGGYAGGIYCEHESVAENMVISDNRAYAAGGIYCSDDSIIKNSYVLKNQAETRGGGILGERDFTVLNCSVTYNRAEQYGGGIYCNGPGNILNTICYYNTAQYNGNNWLSLPDNGQFFHCITYPTNTLPNGTACMETEPGMVGIGNPHILPGSSCIDAGTNILTGEFDIDYEPRLVGSHIDIGCDELTNLTGELVARIQAPNTGTTVHYPLTFTSDVEGKAIGIAWSIHSDTGIEAVTNALHTAFAWNAPGTYQVVLSAWNNAGSSMATVIVHVASYMDSIAYVSPFGGHVWPFNSWTDAATNIQPAVDACIYGGTVLITNGIYTCGGTNTAGLFLQNRVVAIKPITIASVNGPADTCILGAPHSDSTGMGSNAVRGVFLGEGAVLSGFTVSNGYTMERPAESKDCHGGGIFMDKNTLVTNCIITGNTARHYGGGIFCVTGCTISASILCGNAAWLRGGGICCGYGGTVTSCSISNNFSELNGGGVMCSVGGIIQHVVISGNTSEEGGGVYLYKGGKIQNSIISNNYADGSGGGIQIFYKGTVLQSTIQGNSAVVRAGGIYCQSGGEVYNCFIQENAAETNDGGGFYSYMGGTVRGCVIYSNTAARAGGGAFCGEEGMLESCTVTGNTAGEQGGGVYTFIEGTVRNCIVCYNSAGQEGNNWFSFGERNRYQYSCTTPTNMIPGVLWCIGEDPQFVDAGNRNFNLMESSPCIDKGINIVWMYDALDIAGSPRINDDRVDMGAYEFIPEPAAGISILIFLLYSIKRKRI